MIEVYSTDAVGVAAWWGDQIPMMTMEEAGELIQAISKYERYKICSPVLKEEYQRKLIDEIGDMYISLRALQERYNIPDEKIQDRINYKLHKKYDEEEEN